MMKKCFEIHGRDISLVDEENLFFEIDNGRLYLDINGKELPPYVKYKRTDIYDDSDDPWASEWIEYEGIEEKLVSASITEVKFEIDDIFGNFGFKNKAGKFVIEPQYAFANEFTCGLASVNLNRTWYRTVEGKRYYENHFGYINNRGETVIPFIFDEAWPFNKYGVAVVDYRLDDEMLIDLKGNFIPGTKHLNIDPYYYYNDRFLEFIYKSEQYNEDAPIGLYDTKERKIFLEPSIESHIEWDEENIEIYDISADNNSRPRFINSKGERLYEWLTEKEFDHISIPNKSSLAIVGKIKWVEVANNPFNDGRLEKEYTYGVYSAKKKIEIPLEYERIWEVSENVFVCRKGERVSAFRYEG